MPNLVRVKIKQAPTGIIPASDYSAAPDPFAVKRTLQPDPRNQANIEAERGETALGDFVGDGTLQHMDIGGNKHVDGGTPLNVPADTFIYSDTKDMKIKGDLLKFFGKSGDSKKGYTPADLAKQYDLNKYKAILDDPDSDPIARKTAELMTKNYTDKLGQLAFVQEASKGFPNGIPNVAKEFAQSMMPHSAVDQDAPAQGQPAQQPQPGQSAMKYGGFTLPKAQDGKQVNPFVDENGNPIAAPVVTTSSTAIPPLPIIPASAIQKSGQADNNHPGDGAVYTDHTNTDNMAPDVWALNNANAQAMRLKKYLPYIPTPDPTLAAPTFYDPSREIAANQETANAQGAETTAFGAPQQQRANQSSIAGQTARANADVIAKYDNMNVGVANTYSKEEAETMNNFSALRAKNEKDLYDGNVIANQYYDNAVNLSDDDRLKAQTNEWNNRAQLEMTNKVNKYYSVDPDTGHLVFTPLGVDRFQGNNVQGQAAGFNKDHYASLLATITSANPGLSADEKHKWVMQQMEGNRESQTFNGQSPVAAKTIVKSYMGE